MGDANPRYEHDQRAPLHLLLHLIAGAMIVAAWSSMDQPWLAVLLASVGGLFSLLGLREGLRELGQPRWLHSGWPE